MKSTILIICTLCFSVHIHAQIISDFENIQVPDNSYVKDAGPEGQFTSGGIHLPNMYTDTGNFDFWNGWVISNVTDSLTPGFINEAASWAGRGYNSDNYAVSYAPGPVGIQIMEDYSGSRIEGMYITNSTYAALSMRDGDAFAKKFGGASGDDPDYFYVSIKKWLNGDLSQDSVIFYLADYRFEDNSQDYIVKDWTWLDLQPLGEVDSLQFEMHSSDTGSFGINTPTYFCVDDVHVKLPLSASEESFHKKDLVYPNPAVDKLNIHDHNGFPFTIYTLNGQAAYSGVVDKGYIDIRFLESGIYVLVITEDNSFQVQRFVKK